MPIISIVIPCYNQGQFLAQSIGSVLASGFDDLEIILVDDGSTDSNTVQIISELDYPRTKIIRQHNQGLAAARNAGIAAASGRYILPLDADDRIAPNYIKQGVQALEQDSELGIVYCAGEKFGMESGRIRAASFTTARMRFSNLIFASALFRKEDWQQSGGYKSCMKHGCEDWEFWISILELGRKVLRLPDTMFFYRISDSSMNARMDREKRLAMHRLIVSLHPGFFPPWFSSILPLYYRLINLPLWKLIKNCKLFDRVVLNYKDST